MTTHLPPVEAESRPRGRSIFDFTINVQSAFGAFTGAAIACVIGYFALVSRIEKLEGKDPVQDDRMGRIEQAMREQRSDTNQQLREIKDGQKEQSDKIDKLRDLMIQNSPMGRQDMRRWVK
ncbi:hypothetical protein [uncultured Herbaspirillum sp.]|uniref:hypothetical protein n=1 Tax=uncultured Herbaspirillum sp. TaxID=160236 RepID=UPI002603AD15|nr:hypothetical protein [uncultured Herbaspirillum sp.]